jgi:hypothetical protein
MIKLYLLILIGFLPVLFKDGSRINAGVPWTAANDKQSNQKKPSGSTYYKPKINITARNFQEMKFDKAIAFTYNTAPIPTESEIIDRNTLNYSAKIPGIFLNKAQGKHLLSVINSKGTYDKAITDCFKPHMGIVFYDKDSIVKGYISISFDCNQLTSNPPIPALDYLRIKNGGSIGFSKSGRIELQNICSSLGLGECKPAPKK